jgi:N-acetyl-beta-hexosaminidase
MPESQYLKSAPNAIHNVRQAWLDELAACATRKKLKLSSDGGDCCSKKYKRSCGSASGEVWRSWSPTDAHISNRIFERGFLMSLMIKAGMTPETSVNWYQSTRRYNSEDSPYLSFNRILNAKICEQK